MAAVCAGFILLQTCGAAVKVPEAEAKRAAIEKPAPAISALAQQLKISGRIELEVTIAATGSVEAVKPLTGNPLLMESAMTAVKKWRFRPFLENGAATSAVTTLTFEFKQ
jgi:protein TonB